MDVSVILSTYNSPDWLEKVLWGYSCQSQGDFEVVIADDGSGDETRRRIEALGKRPACGCSMFGTRTGAFADARSSIGRSRRRGANI